MSSASPAGHSSSTRRLARRPRPLQRNLRAALEPVKSRCASTASAVLRPTIARARLQGPRRPAHHRHAARDADSLDEDSKTHFAAVTAALDAAGVPYTRNHRLVRGLDYYTRTTFEFTHGGLGAQNALLGGGRYDGLSEAIGAPELPASASPWAKTAGAYAACARINPEPSRQADAFIAPLGESLNAPSLALARDLRRAGLSIELGDGSFRSRSPSKPPTRPPAPSSFLAKTSSNPVS